MILKEVSYLIKTFIWSKYNKNINIVKYYYNNKLFSISLYLKM